MIQHCYIIKTDEGRLWDVPAEVVEKAPILCEWEGEKIKMEEAREIEYDDKYNKYDNPIDCFQNHHKDYWSYIWSYDNPDTSAEVCDICRICKRVIRGEYRWIITKNRKGLERKIKFSIYMPIKQYLKEKATKWEKEEMKRD